MTRLFSRSNRDLLVELVRATFVATDHNSAFGVVWSLVGPLAMLLVLYLVFSARFGSEVGAYPLYLLVGIALASFFVTGTRYMITVFAVNAPLVQNSAVPRETLVASRLSVHLFNLLAQLLLCGCLSVYYGLLPWHAIPLAIPLLIAYVALVAGIGLGLALIHAFARDVEHIWNLFAPLVFFATPIFYQLDSLSPVARAVVYWLNPLTPFVLAFRDQLMADGVGGWGAFWHSLVLGSVAFAIGYAAFLTLEHAVVERA
ncbi:MAG: ABC transporter permease [Chloroflexi bacterium]|nr:ABC transporter permease [Chloroflexota bacterium]